MIGLRVPPPPSVAHLTTAGASKARAARRLPDAAGARLVLAFVLVVVEERPVVFVGLAVDELLARPPLHDDAGQHAYHPVSYTHLFAGGLRKNDLQVRLKYAGLKAQLVDTASDVFAGL